MKVNHRMKKDLEEGGRLQAFKGHTIILKKGAFGDRITNVYEPRGQYLGPYGSIKMAKLSIEKRIRT